MGECSEMKLFIAVFVAVLGANLAMHLARFVPTSLFSNRLRELAVYSTSIKEEKRALFEKLFTTSMKLLGAVISVLTAIKRKPFTTAFWNSVRRKQTAKNQMN